MDPRGDLLGYGFMRKIFAGVSRAPPDRLGVPGASRELGGRGRLAGSWNALVPEAWLLTPGSGAVEHVIGGSHDCAGGWCPNCDRPLMQLMALDLSDPALAAVVAPDPVLRLLFCHRCGVAWSPFFYALLPGDVRIVEAGREPPMDEMPYDDYPVCFPPLVASFVPLPAVHQEVIVRLNSGALDEADLPRELFHLDEPQHQVGGEPYLMQGREELDCCACRRPMHFLAAVADNCSDPRGFTSNEYVQVIYFMCTACTIVGAIQRCD